MLFFTTITRKQLSDRTNSLRYVEGSVAIPNRTCAAGKADYMSDEGFPPAACGQVGDCEIDSDSVADPNALEKLAERFNTPRKQATPTRYSSRWYDACRGPSITTYPELLNFVNRMFLPTSACEDGGLDGRPVGTALRGRRMSRMNTNTSDVSLDRYGRSYTGMPPITHPVLVPLLTSSMRPRCAVAALLSAETTLTEWPGLRNDSQR